MSRAGAVSRRDFMRTGAGAGAALGGLAILGATARGQAAKAFKVGLIGCGGRGRGALGDILNAGKALNVDLRVVALADAFPDKVAATRGMLKGKGQDVPEAQCFTGFDAYKKLIATDVEIVLMCTSPTFRPVHFEAAVQAGKHIFVEKPVAVDPVGCRRMFAAGAEAAKKGIGVLAGTCLRHEKGYGGLRQLIADGAIGRPLGGVTYYCIGRLGFVPRAEGWSDAEYMVRNWYSFAEMSGDHIVEQDVHTIDMQNWCMGATPLAAVGIGARHRRQTGDQYDCFSVDYEYPGQVHVHNICRQINGCWNWGNGIHLTGEKGWARIGAGVTLWDGTKVPPPAIEVHGSMYVQEHYVLLDSLLKGTPINNAKDVTEASLTAILGRTAAYTGRKVEWKELVDPAAKSDLYGLAFKPSPEDFEAGQVTAPKDGEAPVPGKA
ncbi:MAG TPA: Gfo/Idh/MocA family oxidoreductase [Planctomycetota bacterium]|nr:Gfo/Idh/MocA family oxidoreductase [Planctomycetota bacterium]